MRFHPFFAHLRTPCAMLATRKHLPGYSGKHVLSAYIGAYQLRSPHE
ncbi:hypothetical protein HMPREF0762_00378 [Slackia exigua ATCC 700122]|uniref:Uncharacterized protein n=1 Tax=Slackia exigua (strain ATCC 700122 / DSM 15923 / CIP 105133 / JCM 11022 / KCTC 5966 / S-7) TaxID=649764 RepID=D0WEZ2_SLAES|nr:hypothetical protein HMPREF0762_00378 [Slackia exigua ATCC 700122]